MLWYLRLIAVALLVVQTRVAAIGQTTDELAGCVAFLRQNVTGAAEANVGSGFLVQVNDTPFLVTAAHVARAVGADWNLVRNGVRLHRVDFILSTTRQSIVTTL